MSRCFVKYPPSPPKCATLCHKCLKPKGVCGFLQNLWQHNIFICTCFLFWLGRNTDDVSLVFNYHSWALPWFWLCPTWLGTGLMDLVSRSPLLSPLSLGAQSFCPGLCFVCSHGPNSSSRNLDLLLNFSLVTHVFQSTDDALSCVSCLPAVENITCPLTFHCWVSPLGPTAAHSRPPDARFAFSCLFLIKCFWHDFLPAGAQKFTRPTPRFCLSKNTLLIFRACCLSRLLHLNVATHIGQVHTLLRI